MVIACTFLIIIFQFTSFLDLLRRYKYLWLILGLFLTTLTIFFGTNPSGYGPKLWFRFFDVYFQPSEPLKLLLIAFAAGYFADKLPVYTKNISFLLPTLVINSIAILLLIFQRDLGTATIFLIIYLAMLYSTLGNKIVLWVTPILFIIAGLAGYFFIDVVKLRIDTWLTPFQDPTGASYQIIQSWIAIAEGRIFGTGPGLGSPNFIPVAISDFIYPAISEETGLLGATIIILLIILFVYRGIKISASSSNSFNRYLSIGLVFYFGFQSIMIIGGNLGLVPLTGVTLPFVSYGGTSLLVSFIGLLFLLLISSNTPLIDETKNPEYPGHLFISFSLIALMIFEIIITTIFSFWTKSQLVERAENPRWIVDDRFVERGRILDRNNNIIISNTGEIGSFVRTSNHIPLYPIIGYTNAIYGQTGVELTMYSYLRGLQGYPFPKLLSQELFYNQPPAGLDIRLTIDLDLQKTADELLGDLPGAIVVMNANSGEILAMASHPYFNAAELSSTWEDLINDDSAPLVNRVTQGSYAPGTSLFPVLFLKANLAGVEITDPIELYEKNSEVLNCVLSADETLSWGAFINQGCLNAQEDLADILGFESVFKILQSLGLFSKPSMYLDLASANAPNSGTQRIFFNDKNSFSITPLQMALAASAISNGGILPGPRLVSAYFSPEKVWETIPKLTPNQQVISKEIANEVALMMEVPGNPYWQAVAMSHNPEDNENATWFLAGTTSNWPGQPLTIVILLETADPFRAQEIGQSLIQDALRYQTNR
jgi:cell division protein FtsW (lipid II flippase)